jgi:hypothetical protein
MKIEQFCRFGQGCLERGIQVSTLVECLCNGVEDGQITRMAFGLHKAIMQQVLSDVEHDLSAVLADRGERYLRSSRAKGCRPACFQRRCQIVWSPSIIQSAIGDNVSEPSIQEEGNYETKNDHHSLW